MDTPRLPKGRYRARALQGEFGYSPNKGTEQVVVEFELLDEQWRSERVTWIGYFTGNTTERTLEALRFCGWTGDDVTDLTGLGNGEVSLVIDHEEYDGKLMAKVQWVNKGGLLAMKAPMSPDQKKAFAAKMRGAAVKSRAAVDQTAAAGTNGKGGAAPF